MLGPLLFLIYINDLHLAIKHSETFHFTDDTHLLHFAKTISSLCSKINADLRILTCWLNANKIFLNSSKTEFILFRSRSKPLNFTPFLKLLGKRIYPNSSVKYLGIRIDQYLDWKSHISETSIKLRRATGALSNPIFSDLGILKFFNLVEVLNILFVHQLFNVDLPEDLLDTFDFSKISHAWAFLKSSVNTKTYSLHFFSRLSIQHSETNFSRAFLTLILQKFLFPISNT